METGVLAALQYTARNGAGHAAQLLAPRAQRGRARGETEKPYAIAIPEKQDDRAAPGRAW